MNIIRQNYSKEAIQARMLQNATQLWGVKNIQSLDPFVKLLIDAFSTEVFKANNEIQTINGRILEKLARLLTPSRYAHPSPAHAIAFCAPSEDRQLLLAHSEFFTKKQVNTLQKDRSDRQVNISLTAVDHVELIRAQTVLMVAGNTVYSIDEQLNKLPVARLPVQVEAYRTMKLGIDLSAYESEKFPERLALYASNPTFEHVDFVYRLLPHVRVYHGSEELQVAHGLTYADSPLKEGFEGIFEEQSLHHKIRQDIKGIYHDRFIEISGFSRNTMKNTEVALPNELDDGTAVWDTYRGKKLLWLTLEFPPQFTAEILENFLFVTNAFPVYNRAWKKTEYALDIMGNNIPLDTSEDEFFLYVDEVLDGQGNRYGEIPFTPSDHMEKGLYTVRKGGMERFTDRNAIDLMSHLMELLRDEVAAFSIINRDKVKEVLGEISEKMKGLMQKVEMANRELREDVNYVIIQPLEDSAHTYASFWVTHGPLANAIRPGTVFNSQRRLQSITLVTPTSGGVREQKQSDTIQAYKYALTTRDKIISVEDIRNYCKMALRNEVKKITVSRGTMISDRPKEGFVRTVDVTIVPQDFAFYGAKYWDQQAEILRNSIKSKAIDGVEYRVSIQEEAAMTKEIL